MLLSGALLLALAVPHQEPDQRQVEDLKQRLLEKGRVDALRALRGVDEVWLLLTLWKSGNSDQTSVEIARLREPLVGAVKTRLARHPVRLYEFGGVSRPVPPALDIHVRLTSIEGGTFWSWSATLSMRERALLARNTELSVFAESWTTEALSGVASSKAFPNSYSQR